MLFLSGHDYGDNIDAIIDNKYDDENSNNEDYKEEYV